jgi:hypothetical protein
MDATRRGRRHEQSVRSRFARYGVAGGVVIGFLLGVLYSGPHINDWSPSSIGFVTLGFAVGGLLLGYLSEFITKATMAEGATGAFGPNGERQFSTDGIVDDHHDSGAGIDGGGGDGGGGSGGGVA